jgi:4-amino-4-deoxy-L-arabinose transferase-like glycosyltransferase
MMKKGFFSQYKWEVVVFCIAIVLRLGLFGVNFIHNEGNLVNTIKGDDGYYELSQNILAGNGFSFDTASPYRPNPLRPPVWPYVIAGTASVGGYGLVLALELLMGSLIPVFGLVLARRLFGALVGRWTGIIMAVEPYSILLSFILYTETCFTFFFLLSLVHLMRFIDERDMMQGVLSGLILGLAILVKPTVQFFPLLIPLFLLIAWRRELTKNLVARALLVGVLAGIVMLPWAYRNKVEFGVWGMSAQPAFNLYVYLVPTVLSIDNNTNFKTELDSFVYRDGFDINSITLANAGEYKDRAMEVLLEHKGALVESALITLITFLTHDGMLTVLQYSGITFENILNTPALSLLAHPTELLSVLGHYATSPAILIPLVRIFWILTTIFMIWGIVVLFRLKQMDTKKMLALLIILYFATTTAINGLGVNARFRVPVLVFMFSFALYGLFALRGYILGKLKKRHEEAFNHHTGV